jgi:hypothetical protein
VNTDEPYAKTRARLDNLARLLAEVGPISKIEDPVAKGMATIMQTLLTIVTRRLDGPPFDSPDPYPDEGRMLSMLDAAVNEYHQLKVQLEVVPALKQRHRRKEVSAEAAPEGGKATAKKFARPDLDDLIRGCLARGEKPPAKAWADDFDLSLTAVYNRINKIKKPKRR